MALLLGACALTAVPTSAWGDAIAVVPFAATGEVPADELEQLADAVAAELRRRAHEVLFPSEARAGIERTNPGCMAAPGVTCIAEALHQMQWPSFVRGHVTREPGGQTSISLELYEATGARRIAADERSSPASQRAQSSQLARESIGAIVDSLARGAHETFLRVASNPNGATVRSRDDAVHSFERDGRSPAPGSGRPIIGPVLLGIGGLAFLVIDAIVLATARCDEEAPDGSCLRGETVAVVPLIVVGGAGVLSVGAALTWFVIGGSADQREASAR